MADISGNTWEALLARQIGSSKRPSASSVLILGSPSSGKRSLVSSLCKMSKIMKGEFLRSSSSHSEKLDMQEGTPIAVAGLGYAYLMLPFEDAIKLNLWIVEEHKDEKETMEILDIVMPDLATLDHSAAVVMVDLSKPWDAEKTLDLWSKRLKCHIDRLIDKNVEKSQIDDKIDSNCNMNPFERVEALVRAAKLHASNGQRTEGVSISPDHAYDKDIPLPKAMLSENIGIPLFIVASKADTVTDAPEDMETELRLEFIQRYLRQFSLRHGATLSYVSVRSNDRNSRALLCCLFQCLYSTFFHILPKDATSLTSIGTMRDSVHVPAGLDSLELISTLANIQNSRFVGWSADSSYNDIIAPPSDPLSSNVQNSGLPAVLVAAMDDEYQADQAQPNQSFLENLLEQQKSFPDSLPVKPIDAASKALKLFNESSSSMSMGIGVTSPFAQRRSDKSFSGSPAPVAPIGAKSAVRSRLINPGDEEMLTGDGTAETESTNVSSKRMVTAQDVKEDPNLVASFFQNLLEKGSRG